VVFKLSQVLDFLYASDRCLEDVVIN